mmetsp:Transcript_15969/g.47341  ORF Transcript_15969/g.47341 Transcript_15969/m.47341 type:complete len:235 (-) Transcript_15969:610-1314(-)
MPCARRVPQPGRLQRLRPASGRSVRGGPQPAARAPKRRGARPAQQHAAGAQPAAVPRAAQAARHGACGQHHPQRRHQCHMALSQPADGIQCAAAQGQGGGRDGGRHGIFCARAQWYGHAAVCVHGGLSRHYIAEHATGCIPSCMHSCMLACMCACMHTRMLAYVPAGGRADGHACLLAGGRACMHVCMCACSGHVWLAVCSISLHTMHNPCRLAALQVCAGGKDLSKRCKSVQG